VLGAQSSAQRAARAAQMLERGFSGNKLSWLKPSLGTVDALAPIDATPPNLRDEMCGPRRKRPAAEDEEDDVEIATDAATPSDGSVSMYAAGLQPQTMKTTELLAGAATLPPPVIVYTGPTRTGAAIAAADAAEEANQATKGKRGKGAKDAKPKVVAAVKPDAKPDAAKPAAKPDAKLDSKPDAKPIGNSAKPLSSDLKPVAQPAAPAKPAATAATPAAVKPAAPKPAAPKPASAAAKPAPANPADKPAAADKKPDTPRG
jgi:D-alanyl-D-alanine carboxypeptidase